MPDNWSEAQHRRLVRRRAAAIAGIAIVIVVGIVIGSVHGSDTTPGESAAPGYRSGDASVDTSPFGLARPKSYGPTTLPNALFGSTVPTTPTTPTTPPPTTTTLPVPPRQTDPICDAFVDLISLGRSAAGDLDDPDAFAKEVSGDMTVWTQQLRTIDARTYAGAISKLEQAAAKLRDRPSADELRVIMSNLLAPDSRTKPLVDHATQACPAVLQAR